ncbi:endonuclease [Flavobacteriaceae bacterium MHTCC 0001]
MANLKFTLWNAEWFNELFTGNPPVFKADDDKGYMTKHAIGDRINDLKGVINDVDSDVWVIVEGPNQSSELQLFFDRPDVNGTWLCVVQPAGAQSLGLAVRTDTGKFANTPFDWYSIENSQEAEKLKAATNEFRMDTDKDGLDEIHKFERRPLYASINLANGTSFRVVGLHLKSKGVFQSLEWSKWWSKSDGNRKKIIAQCHQIRTHFLNDYLKDPNTKDIPLIICGDINDGPGFDTSEMKIMASGVERLMGSIWHPELCLGNVMFDALSDKDKNELDFRSLYTASFKDPIFNNTYRRSWIDHILYSRNVQHWVKDAEILIKMSSGNPIYKDFPKASDHFPVTCTIDMDALL